MATEVAGIISETSKWAWSLDASSGGVFEWGLHPQDTGGTGNGASFLLRGVGHYQLAHRDNFSSGTATLIFGPLGNYVIFPKVPQGGDIISEEKSVRIGGFVGFDFANESLDDYPTKSNFGLELYIFDQYSVGDFQRGMNTVGAAISIDFGFPLFNLGPVVSQGVRNGDVAETMIGFHLSTRVFGL